MCFRLELFILMTWRSENHSLKCWFLSVLHHILLRCWIYIYLPIQRPESIMWWKLFQMVPWRFVLCCAVFVILISLSLRCLAKMPPLLLMPRNHRNEAVGIIPMETNHPQSWLIITRLIDTIDLVLANSSDLTVTHISHTLLQWMLLLTMWS